MPARNSLAVNTGLRGGQRGGRSEAGKCHEAD